MSREKRELRRSLSRESKSREGVWVKKERVEKECEKRKRE